MEKHSIKTIWKENNTFETDIDGHKMLIDTAVEAGGNDNGPRPKQLMLLAASGCTSMDVVSLLKKMRVAFKDFNVSVDAEMTDEHPITYTEAKITYEFEGENLSESKSKIEKACSLSFNRYCGVIALLKKAIPVTYEVIIKDL